ncbi:MAG: hypothetical protein LBC04_02555, partial [Holosporaceae bacterium]|nr:hypothetical protein [Holosporaceae bacterium]
EHVASLIKTSDEDAIVNVWMDCLSRSYSPTAQASLPGFTEGGETLSLLSYAARTGKPQLVVAMGYVNTLGATDLANLFATFCRYSGAGKGSPLTPAEDALRQVTADLIYCWDSMLCVTLKPRMVSR